MVIISLIPVVFPAFIVTSFTTVSDLEQFGISGGEVDPFEAILEEKKRSHGIELDTDLNAQALKELVVEFKYEIWKRKQIRFPEDPWDQLWGAIGAVFGSWENPRADDSR